MLHTALLKFRVMQYTFTIVTDTKTAGPADNYPQRGHTSGTIVAYVSATPDTAAPVIRSRRKPHADPY